MTLLFGIAGGFALCWLWLLLWQQYVRINPLADEVYFAQTLDGATITLYRYLPHAGRPAHATPLLLCHGLMANHLNFDLGTPRGSLSRFLSGLGYDVWLLELRGQVWTRPRPFSFRKFNWSFTHYARYDAPRAIDFVLEKTGAEKLVWIGHSMGGMLGYAMASGAQHTRLAALIAIGSPVHFGALRNVRFLARLFLRFYPLPLIPADLTLKFLAPFLAVLPFGRVSLLGNPRNFSIREKLIILGNILGSVPAMLMREFALGAVTGNFRSQDDFVNFFRDFNQVETPLLMIAGGADRLVPAAAMRWGFDNCRSQIREFVEVARHAGFPRDLGHGDLVLSRYSHLTVFPLIEQFLSRTLDPTGQRTISAKNNAPVGLWRRVRLRLAAWFG